MSEVSEGLYIEVEHLLVFGPLGGAKFPVVTESRIIEEEVWVELFL